MCEVAPVLDGNVRRGLNLRGIQQLLKSVGSSVFERIGPANRVLMQWSLSNMYAVSSSWINRPTKQLTIRFGHSAAVPTRPYFYAERSGCVSGVTVV